MNMAVQDKMRVVLVTGPSGAGRATAINALEDFGYEAIDNIPLTLIPRLVEGPFQPLRPLALGIDTRNRDFSAKGVLDLQRMLSAAPGVKVDLLYLDCDADVLERRYSETRRRHPMAPEGTPRDGILREFALFEEVRPSADIIVDTTHLTPHDLRSTLEPWFAASAGLGMAISLESFSYKHGLPRGLDMAFDCRFLSNPHWQPELRPHTGLDDAVAAYVAADPRHAAFVSHLLGLIRFVLPEAAAEGKAHLTLGFGCTGGKHRSVAMTETIGQALAADGWRVSTRHRELERRGLYAPGARVPEEHEKAVR
ncbi:RNase adapter RapZ [Citreimonas sp.]|uniref:RNase adapter RapZ n=1 Tax=Citreimonas sp. TaxID=3036715 RepID=UPI004059B314